MNRKTCALFVNFVVEIVFLQEHGVWIIKVKIHVILIISALIFSHAGKRQQWSVEPQRWTWLIYLKIY